MVMLAELAQGSGLENKYKLSMQPVHDIENALDLLDTLAESIAASAREMRSDTSLWPNGHLWHQCVARVNRLSESSRRVLPKKSVLYDALEYYETIPSKKQREIANVRVGSMGWIVGIVRWLGLGL